MIANKVSAGLTKVLQEKRVTHFPEYQQPFISDPNQRNTYMRLFDRAIEIDQSQDMVFTENRSYKIA